MMKRQYTINMFFTLCTAAVFVLCLSMPAYAQEGAYALLIQSSPPDGGVVSPGMGIQKVGIGQTVTLSATPKQGYRFLYWLGDVESNTGPDTTVTVASPKLIIAVFAREDFDDELPGLGVINGIYGGGGGGFINPVRSAASVNPGAMPIDFDYPVSQMIAPLQPTVSRNPTEEPIETPDDIPVPGEEDDIPVPGDNEIPEPATLLLLGLGSTVFLKGQRKR